jgi:hypothetical protein
LRFLIGILAGVILAGVAPAGGVGVPSLDEVTVVPGGWSPGSRLDHEFSGPLATFMSSDLGCDEPDPYWVLWTVPGVQVVGDLSLESGEPLRQLIAVRPGWATVVRLAGHRGEPAK